MIARQIAPGTEAAESNRFLTGILNAVLRSPRLSSHLWFAGLLALFAGACFFIGMVPTRQYPADNMWLPACGWRVLWGQRPHVDFSSGVGAVTYLISALGIRLAGGTANGLGYGNAIAGLAAGIWGYAILIRRVSGAMAVLGSVMLALVALAPTALGESFRMSGHAMNENRYGFALLGIVIAECFPIRPENWHRGRLGGISTGIACGILLFLKANYFFVGVVLATISLAWNGRREPGLISGLALGFLGFCGIMMGYLRFDAAAVFSDLRMAASARGGAVSPAWIAQIFGENFAELLILLAMAWMIPRSQATEPRDGWRKLILRYRMPLLALLVYCGGVMIVSTNTQQARIAVDEILAVLFLDSLLRRSGDSPRFAAGMIAVGLAVILGPLSTDSLAVLNGVRLKRHPEGPFANRVHAGRFAPAIFLDDYDESRGSGETHGHHMAAYLNDGYDLLRRELKPGDKVTTFDGYNPFPFALGIEPPRGGMASAAYKYIYGDRYHPSVDEYFGDANVVMYPKTPELPKDRFAGLLIYYQPELEKRFVAVAESARWRMYRRKPQGN